MPFNAFVQKSKLCNNLLVIGYYREDLKSLIRIAEAAAQPLKLDPVFLITSTGALLEQAVRQVQGAGFPVVDDLQSEDNSAGAGVRNSFKRFRLIKEANVLVSERILSRIRPRAILCSIDAAYGYLMPTATALGVPSLYVQWTEVHSSEVHRAWRKAENKWVDKCSTPYRRALRKLKRRLDGLAGLGPRWPLATPATQLAVQGPVYREMCIRAGIPTQKIAVTGNVQCDDMFRCASLSDGKLTAVREKLGVPGDVPFLLYAREHVGRISHLESDSMYAEKVILSAMKEAAPRLPRVVKLHPKEGPEERQRLSSIDPNARIIQDELEIGEVIASAAMVISTTSSALLWGIGIDKPTISAYFWKGIDEFKLRRHWSGVEQLDTKESLVTGIQNNLFNEVHKEKWSARRADCRTHFLRVDGQSVNRIVDLLGSLLSPDCNLSSACCFERPTDGPLNLRVSA